MVPQSAAGPFVTARWIAPPSGVIETFGTPLFRREFRLDGLPSKAVLRIVGLGDYDVTVNGRRVAPTGINQPWSQYEKTVYWSEFDVTKLLRSGANCIGVQLGASFWHNPNPPAGRYNKDGPQRSVPEPYLLLAELSVVHEAGRQLSIGTDATWTVHAGPVTFSHVYAGEDYDARLAKPGWDGPGFDDHDWAAARETAGPTGRLVRRDFAGFASYQTDRPSSMRTAPDGAILVRFPQNMSAQLRVQLEGGKPGDRVALRLCEHSDADGRPTGGYVVGCGIVTDGRKVDRRWSHFYLGMQFAEVRGAVLPGAPNPDNLPVLHGMELTHVRCGLPEVGRFRSSSDLLNRTHDLIDWAVRSNMAWVMTDCPHREKLGWLECAYLLAPTFQYRYDGRAWFAKIAQDLRDAQEPNGMVRTVAPSYPAGRFPGAFDWTVEWGAAAVMVPWLHYEWYGDSAILRESLESMRRFTDYVGTLASDGIAPQGLGDWYDYGHGHGPGPSRFTPTDLSSTATWALCALTVSRAAAVLGDSATAERYRGLHAQIAAAFRRRFQDPETKLLRHLGSPQCANAMAICAEVVPSEDHEVLIKDMVADLEKRGWQQTPGDVGHVYFIRALAQAGRSDVLHRVYARTGLGSYGGILAKGLTSMPETWDAMMDGYQSLNHCMLGHVVEWLYGYVGGIRQAPGSVGWRDVVIGPNPGPLTSCEVSLITPRGKVSVSWTIRDGKFRLETSVPRGVAARAVLPNGRTVPLRPGKNVVE
jgi:hypothetical protein